MPVYDDDRRFHTCCCHVRTCTIVIAVLEVLGLICMLISTILGFTHTSEYYYIDIASCVAWCIVIPLLIYGMWKESPTCIIPHIVMQVKVTLYTFEISNFQKFFKFKKIQIFAFFQILYI